MIKPEVHSELFNGRGHQYGIDSDQEYVRSLIVNGENKDVTFSIIVDEEKLIDACSLLNRCYAGRGYGSNESIPVGPQYTTFAAQMDGDVIGTMTLAMDSESGLTIDEQFTEEASAFRIGENVSICELKRLAFDPNIQSKSVMAGLFHLAFIYGTAISDCTDLFIEVHSRHVAFYKAMLGFEDVAEPKHVQYRGGLWHLMRLKVSDIANNIFKMAGSTQSTRSLSRTFSLSNKRFKYVAQ